MVRRQIDLDEETDRVLAELARDYKGDLGHALADLVQAHQGIEAFLGECEEARQAALLAQRERAERSFREGRVAEWGDIKRRNRL